MPQTGKRAEPPTEEERARIVSGPDPDRFYCPHPGCNRSFAELWRLKVHFRAPPDVRGSGKERGHGTELKFCPKCGKDLRPGKHHVGCSAGKSAPRQAAKRQRQQMSTTTESNQALTGATTAGTTEQTSGSWELAVRRQAVRMQQAATEAESTQRTKRAEGCRIESLAQKLEAGVVGAADLLFHATSAVPAPAPAPGADAAAAAAAAAPQHFFPMPPVGKGPMSLDPLAHAAPAAAPSAPSLPAHPPQQQYAAAPAAHPQQQQPPHHQHHHQHQGMAPLPHLDLPQHPDSLHPRSSSPSPLELFGDPFGDLGHHGSDEANGHHGLGLDDGDMLRIPSPPPLPADWDTAPRTQLLFDFDQFDVSKRQQTGGASAPLVTVTTAMNPVDVLNPSDDYIWQILFAGENDAVPKRVTAHLHQPPTALSFLDEADPILDAILSDDLTGLHDQQLGGGEQAQGPATAAHAHAHTDGRAEAADGPHSLLPSLDAVFSQHQHQGPAEHQHQVPQQDAQAALLPSSAGGPAVCVVPQAGMAGQPHPAYRNGFGSHGGELPPAVKLETTTHSFLL